MLVQHHQIELPPGLEISSVDDIVVARDPSRELALFIHPVTTWSPERWVYRTMPDGTNIEIRFDHRELGDNRCTRAISTHDTFRRVILFVETRDGSEGWLPLVLFAKDERHDALLERIAASVLATRTHPFQMWIE